MKKIIALVSVICLSLIAFSCISCSKNDDPADNDLFVGTYKGKVSYSDSQQKKSADNGAVTVVKTGNNYYFRFSDGIPDLIGFGCCCFSLTVKELHIAKLLIS